MPPCGRFLETEHLSTVAEALAFVLKTRKEITTRYAPRNINYYVFPKGIEIGGARKGATLIASVREHQQPYLCS